MTGVEISIKSKVRVNLDYMWELKRGEPVLPED